MRWIFLAMFSITLLSTLSALSMPKRLAPVTLLLVKMVSSRTTSAMVPPPTLACLGARVQTHAQPVPKTGGTASLRATLSISASISLSSARMTSTPPQFRNSLLGRKSTTPFVLSMVIVSAHKLALPIFFQSVSSATNFPTRSLEVPVLKISASILITSTSAKSLVSVTIVETL